MCQLITCPQSLRDIFCHKTFCCQINRSVFFLSLLFPNPAPRLNFFLFPLLQDMPITPPSSLKREKSTFIFFDLPARIWYPETSVSSFNGDFTMYTLSLLTLQAQPILSSSLLVTVSLPLPSINTVCSNPPKRNPNLVCRFDSQRAALEEPMELHQIPLP